MSTLRSIVTGGLLALILPWNALAEGRECIFEPGSGMYLPPNGAGSCFGDNGFLVVVVDPATGDVVIAGGPPDENQWFRVRPDGPPGRGAFHAATDAEFLLFCSGATVAANACFPGSAEAFGGGGEISLNTQSQDFVFTCPFTVRITGSATDGYGNGVDLVAASTRVPDIDFGCRATVSSVKAAPVID